MKRKITRVLGVMLAVQMALPGNMVVFANPAGPVQSEEASVREQAAVRAAKELRKIVERKDARSGETHYAEYYGGSYINEDGNLVVQFCDATEEEEQTIREAVGEAVVFEEVSNSYESLKSEIERMSSLLEELTRKNAAGELNESLDALADSIVGMGTDVKENVNVVYMTDISKEMQEAYFTYFGETDVVFELSAKAETSGELKAAISKRNMVTYPNMLGQLTVRNASSEVKWKVSNKKLVKIIGTGGDNGETVIFRTMGKTGKCKLTARVDGKSYTCKVTVKSDKKLSRVKFSKVVKSKDRIVLEVKAVNRTNKTIEWDREHDYKIEKFVDGKWEDKTLKIQNWTGVIKLLRPKAAQTFSYVVATDENMDEITPGTYRLRVKNFKNESCNTVLFAIK